jgi:nucleotide-binding universal stress UspA family protein
MKALVGVDGSSNSFAAVAFIGKLLSPERDELILFFATPAVTFEDERLDVAIQERARQALSRAVLEAALERLPQPWRSRAVQKEDAGAPGPALVAAAANNAADLVVVGFHGTSSLIEHFMLGSVSRKVLQSAKTPVLVVKSSADQAGSASANALRALVAYDTNDKIEPIASTLHKFTWPPNAEGHVMTVVRPMFLADLPDWVKNQPRNPDVAAMADAWKVEHEQNLVTAREDLNRIRALLPSPFGQSETIVAEGRPAEQIIKTARKTDTDLIILGGSGETGRLERLIVGSTAEQVLASATCSVLLIR